jgi:hypothetical protein
MPKTTCYKHARRCVCRGTDMHEWEREESDDCFGQEVEEGMGET